MTIGPANWEKTYALLEGGTLLPSEICSAIVRLGKPLEPARIRRGASVVAKYLSHSNFLVRHEALWFVGCWGKLHQYLAQIIEAAKGDPDADNRAYAARCAGQVLMEHKDTQAIESLLQMAKDGAEISEVRLACYVALLYAYKGQAARAEANDYEPTGDKSVADMDTAWLDLVGAWAHGLS